MDWRGLILFIPAIMLLMLSFRVGQPRVAVGALPLIFTGRGLVPGRTADRQAVRLPAALFLAVYPLPLLPAGYGGTSNHRDGAGALGGKHLRGGYLSAGHQYPLYRRTLGCLQYCRRVQRHAFPDGTAHAVRSLGLPVRLEILEKMRALPQRDSPGRHRQRCPASPASW